MNSEPPIYFEHAYKSRLWDYDGNEYLDLHNKYGSVLLGHNDKNLIHAIKNCIGTQVPENAIIGYKICELLKQVIPCCEMAQFGLSGTEMVKHALRLARKYNGRDLIIRFAGSYHGGYDELNSVPDQIDAFENTHKMLVVPWNNLNILYHYVEKYKNRIAAIISEVVCVNSGSIIPDPNFLKGLRQLCSEKEIVLIFDEIITGFRIESFSAQSYYQIEPDLCLIGKCLTNGFIPVTILAGKKEIMETYLNGLDYAGTFNGYSLGLDIAYETLKQLIERLPTELKDMHDKINQIHNLFLNVCREFNIKSVIQGMKSFASFHINDILISSYSELTPDILNANNIVRKCMQKNGILISPISRIYPNLSITKSDVDFFEKQIGKALYEASRILRMKR